MTAETSWADRFWRELPTHLEHLRVEALWRTFAPNGLDLLIGDSVADLGGTRGVLSATSPDEWVALADFIESLLDREPLKRQPRYSGQRIILGTLANELRGYALAAERHAA